MAGAYAKHDSRIVDYDLYTLDPPIVDPVTRCPLELRGPRPRSLDRDRYFVCVGGAQTFGRFCTKPYPFLLQERLGLSALNLGRGGAGPSFFSPADDVLRGYIGGARFAILQVMSGRSAGNSLFRSNGLGSYSRRSDGTVVLPDDAFRELLRERSREEVRRIVAETRAEWLCRFRELLEAISIPKILFWFSVRKPHRRDRYDDVPSLFREFPQLVNEEMIRELRPLCDHYVSCASSRGLPQRLTDRFTGEPVEIRDEWSGLWSHNDYYPSPEMHLQAADALERVAQTYVTGARGGRISAIRRALIRCLGRA